MLSFDPWQACKCRRRVIIVFSTKPIKSAAVSICDQSLLGKQVSRAWGHSLVKLHHEMSMKKPRDAGSHVQPASAFMSDQVLATTSIRRLKCDLCQHWPYNLRYGITYSACELNAPWDAFGNEHIKEISHRIHDLISSLPIGGRNSAIRPYIMAGAVAKKFQPPSSPIDRLILLLKGSRHCIYN